MNNEMNNDTFYDIEEAEAEAEANTITESTGIFTLKSCLGCFFLNIFIFLAICTVLHKFVGHNEGYPVVSFFKM